MEIPKLESALSTFSSSSRRCDLNTLGSDSFLLIWTAAFQLSSLCSSALCRDLRGVKLFQCRVKCLKHKVLHGFMENIGSRWERNIPKFTNCV